MLDTTILIIVTLVLLYCTISLSGKYERVVKAQALIQESAQHNQELIKEFFDKYQKAVQVNQQYATDNHSALVHMQDLALKMHAHTQTVVKELEKQSKLFGVK